MEIRLPDSSRQKNKKERKDRIKREKKKKKTNQSHFSSQSMGTCVFRDLNWVSAFILLSAQCVCVETVPEALST